MTTTAPVDALPVLNHRDRRRTVPAHDAADRCALVLSDGGTEERELLLGPGTTCVGRSWLADIVLDDPTVSRRHATLLVHDDGALVLDDRSADGTFLNGQRVTAASLRDGDHLQFGRVRLTVRAHRAMSAGA